MIQQQIVDYAKAQLGAGLSEEVIKGALLQAGWVSADVDDSIKSVTQKKQPEPARATTVASVSPIAASMPSMVAKPQVSPQSINVRDLFGTAGKGSASFPTQGTRSPISEIQPMKKTETLAVKEMAIGASALKPSRFGRSKIVLIVLTVVAIVSAGAAVYFYMNNKSLSEQVTKLTADSSSNSMASSQVSALTSQLADVTKAKAASDSQAAVLTKNSDELQTELSFFVAPPLPAGATSSPALAFSLSGMLAVQSNTLYSVTASSGLMVSIKNSKDAKVDAALKPLVGKSVEISGTHPRMSRDVTVTSVNGASVQ